MAEVRIEEEIAAPAAAVWKVRGDFGGVGRWLLGAPKLELEGSGVDAARRFEDAHRGGPRAIAERVAG